ncbi:serine hydroxymethyltransferase [candidate division TM6 bacterium JCVI TM6SC1]|uniref:Serine hydroxymethyltransferase n=1 Tax=candidate division TM6 bacterium JCVI TM6SC1 TaxID=1306947 RepID=A0A0D2JE90_9BACT|nr:serine hydroxymethyltransferase [candidate division TM6 bacterium JCVI TM6SC1]
MISDTLLAIDPVIAHLINQERDRQEHEIDLIASENYASDAVLQATGSVLTNKYAEGYPGKRYYGGCGVIDVVERIAIERAQRLFNAEYVNVQPHSGSSANTAVFLALLNPGDTIMGMRLSEGGHLTHGHPVNISGKVYKSIQYGVDKYTHTLNYDMIEALAQEHKPRLIIAGASAYCRTIDFERFAQIARSVNAYFMADIAHIAGLIAAGLHPSPVPYADVVTTTTHKTLRGPRGGMIMAKAAHAQALDRAIMPGSQGGPLMHVIAAKAVAFEQALNPSFALYQRMIVANAQALAYELSLKGYNIVTGGTDTHLFVVDLTSQNITGKDAEKALEMAGIAVSKSCIPFDVQKPHITSGIRIGTPAITTRGMLPEHASIIAGLIDQVLKDLNNPNNLESVKHIVKEWCLQHPIYIQRKI